jgi:hypothetical protein
MHSGGGKIKRSLISNRQWQGPRPIKICLDFWQCINRSPLFEEAPPSKGEGQTTSPQLFLSRLTGISGLSFSDAGCYDSFTTTGTRMNKSPDAGDA